MIIPEVFDHLDEQRHQAATPPRGGDNMPRGSGHSDPTASQAIALAALDDRRQHIIASVDRVHEAISALDDACRVALGHRATNDDLAAPQARCIGDGTADGAQCWAIPAERRTASGQTVNDGRCIHCGPRWDQQRSAIETARRQRRKAS